MLQARGEETGDQQAALEQLCQQYWYPLYAYLRSLGNDAEKAADLTQGFFVDLLEKQVLDAADLRRGRFRSFLLGTLNHFVNNQHRPDQAIKRGGNAVTLSLDFEHADRRFQSEPSVELPPDRRFLRQWALQILELALQSLEQQYQQNDNLATFESLKPYLSPGCEIPYKEVAGILGIQEGAVKVAVHRLRQRYGQELRLQIAHTVQDPADVDDELRHLFDALQQAG